MKKTIPDEGVLTKVTVNYDDKRIDFYNAFAANDPESSLMIWNSIVKHVDADEHLIILLNTRKDRQDRAKQLIELIALKLNYSSVALIGDVVDLVVEDDPVSFLLLKEILKPTNYQVYHSENGKDAVEFIQKNTDVDLILMDVNLPVMNGHEATKEIRKFNPKIPIIAQTANAMSGDKEKALEAGCTDFLTKPIQAKLLLEKVSLYLSK